MDLETLTSSFFVLLVLLMGGGFVVLLGGWYLLHHFLGNRRGKNPYTGLRTLRPLADLGFQILSEIQIYLHDTDPVYFPDLDKAAVCEKSGRIFPNAISRFGRIQVPHDFETKVYPGKWIKHSNAVYTDPDKKKKLQWLSIPRRDLEIFLVQKSPSMPS